MAASRSGEYATLVQCADKLARGISQDPLVVANKLLEAGLVPPRLVSTMSLPNKCDYDKATELVMQVLNVVEGFPRKFGDFLKTMEKFDWLDDLVRMVCEKYEVIKKDTGGVIAVKQDSEELTNLRQEKDNLEKENIILLEKEAAEKLKFEIERERNRILRGNMTKLLEMLTSVHRKERESVRRRIEMKAKNRRLYRKIQVKKKEIRSLKKCIRIFTES